MRDKLINITRSIRLPSICLICKQFHKGPFAVCSFCTDLMAPLGPCCDICAYPLPETSHLVCGKCIKNPPHFDQSFITYAFEEPLRGLIHQFKYQNGLYLCSFLSHLMRQALAKKPMKAQCLIPVPLHVKRLRERGFNQAALLAKQLAKSLELPLSLNACKKVKNTASQANLNAKQRKKNLKKAFQATQIPYQHVILVDDLLTTGSTANELALSLKQAGVQKVDLWCCARAIHLP